LEDWIPSALRLTPGKVLSAELKIPASETTPKGFTLELFARFRPNARGPFIVSEDPGGFALSFTGAGALRFAFGAAGVEAAGEFANDRPFHLLAEYDGDAKELRLHVDGKLAASAPCAAAPTFETDTVIVVGGALDATYEYLRVTLSSLAQSLTTIHELYTWEFDGPHLRDFTGKKSTPNRPAGALDIE